MQEELRREFAERLLASVEKLVGTLSGRVEKRSIFGSYIRREPDLFTGCRTFS